MATVAISGISSFTGLWIAKAFLEAGHQVVGFCTRSSFEDYDGTLPGRRLARLPRESLVFGMRSDDGSMAKWIASSRIDVFVHHHHFMVDFRSPNYDLARSRRVGLEALPGLVEASAKAGAKGIIATGTYFESLPKEISPYGFSKKEVWASLGSLCAKAKLPLSKIIVANPIGPLENNDRLIPTLVRMSRAGAKFELRTPRAISYSLPATTIAQSYVQAAEDLVTHGKSETLSPSAGPISNSDLVDEVLRELVTSRLGLKACEVERIDNGEPDRSLPFVPANTTVDWKLFWDDYAKLIRESDQN